MDVRAVIKTLCRNGLSRGIAILGLVLGVGAAGQLPVSDTPYEITLRDAAQLQLLTDLGFDISHVHGNHATVHNSAVALEILSHLGIPYREREIGDIPADWGTSGKAKTLGQYHSYADLTDHLESFVETYPALCRLISLGQSVLGRELWALEITDNPGVEEDEPEFKYISTMHGNEFLGTEMLLYLTDYLLSRYGTDTRVTKLVNETDIWFVPLMNPDGHAQPVRFNANGIDLNRSFPQFSIDFNGAIFDGEPLGDTGREPETRHIMQWSAANSFVLSANMHTGALVVNYPYDDDGVPSGTYAATPDDGLFVDISLRYSEQNPPMYNSFVFEDGITNGAQWYVITGGMQDWNYRYLGCNEVTLELHGPQFIPSESRLPDLWDDNRESMLRYMEAAHIGVRGLIRDATTGQPVWTRVRVEGNSQPVFNDPDVGDYYRMLLPGTYALHFDAEGFFDRAIAGVDVDASAATRLDLMLVPLHADVDGDDAVGATDVQIVINAALGLGGEGADLNGDGNVDAADVQGAVNSALSF